MTLVSSIRRGTGAGFPVDGRGGRPGAARAHPASDLALCGRPAVGSRAARPGSLSMSVTTSGEMLMDW